MVEILSLPGTQNHMAGDIVCWVTPSQPAEVPKANMNDAVRSGCEWYVYDHDPPYRHLASTVVDASAAWSLTRRPRHDALESQEHRRRAGIPLRLLPCVPKLRKRPR